ncbi:MAG: hypothetical protein IJZ53_02365 [Tyzzerella sp.]|nr:hypothetical protein [Tyzzerella sp.]
MRNRRKLVISSMVLVWVLVLAGLGLWVGINNKKSNDILKEVGWYNPECKEYTISTKEELYDVAALSKYFDFKGQTIYLSKDIEVNKGDAAKWSKELPESVWSPIEGFAGTFDGKGHTISGIYAYGVNSSVGLFTETKATCTIKNLRLENSYILGLNDDGTGSIIGCGSGTLDTVYSNAIVEGQTDNVGGLIGYIKAGKTNLVQNCWFDGEVNATKGTTSYVGGLVGKVLSNTSLCKIMDCLNTADVNANGEYVGGFIGAIIGETNMWLTDCLSTGDVKGAEGAKTVAMAVGAVFKQVSLTTKTCWVQEGSYEGRFGNAAGEIKGILASAPKEKLQGFDAYTYTTLEFDRAWAVQEKDIPMLKCFAKNDPDLSGVVKLLDVSWYDEKSAELHIENLAQLNGFNFLSQVYNYSGQKIVLDNDITINEGKAKDWAKNAPEYEWTPVGRYVDELGKTKGQTFAGTFDGNGHTISGMYINVDSTKAFAVGFFGKVIGKIQNLSLVNSYIGGTAGGNVGTFAASFAGGIAENLYSDAIIDIDANHVGGIVGRDESEATFINCWFDGAVKGKERVGGIMGSMNNNTTLTIQHCLNSGSVHSTSYYAGGLSGLLSNGVATVEDSLNVGKITTDKAEKWCGGIAGVVNGKEGIGIKATIKNTYSLISANKLAYGLNGPERKIIGVGGILLTEGELNGNNAYQFTNLNFKEYWSVVKGKSPVLRTFATGTMKASGSKLADMNWYTVEGKSFKISTAAQLRGLAILSRTNTFEGQTIELTQDIKLPENLSWEPIGKHVDGAKNTVGQIFKGTFKGNGHTIEGLNIELGENAVAYGLFGQVAGTIQDLRLKDGKITGKAVSAIGSLAGSLVGEATISNIYSNVTINVDANYVGGIVGKNEGKTKNIITNCWNDGLVSGTQRVAGIVGYSAKNSELEITHCLNTKEITSASEHYVAGLCGLADQCKIAISDSLNIGKISTTSDKALGYSGAILGGVNGKEDSVGTASIKNIYYLASSCTRGANVVQGASKGKYVTVTGNGTIALTEEYLTDENAYVWTDLDFKNYWTVVKKDTPVLKAMAEKAEAVSAKKLVDTSWYDVTGTTFDIDTAEKLAGLALLSRSNTFSGQTFNVVKDIKLPNVSWEPIGKHVDADKNTVGQIFAGTFNGNGHTISGLTMELTGNEVAYGLFGQVSGTVKDLRLEDGKITGKANSAIGSVAGSLVGGTTVSDIYSNVTVDVDANYVGGIVGKNEGTKKNTISNCWNDGAVTGNERVAGILGYSAKNSELEITHCLNTEVITSASEHYAAGICGLADQGKLTIKDSLNTGKIATTSEKALGYSAAIVGGIKGTEEALGTATLENVYYLTSSCKDGAKVLQDGNGGKYVTLNGNGVIGLLDRELNDKNAYAYTTLDYSKYWTAVKNEAPVLTTLAENAEAVTGTSLVDTNWYDVAGKEFDIDTAEELRGFALLSRTHNFQGQTINLVKDVKLAESMDWEPIGKHVDGNGNTMSQVFAGTFNGNRYAISGMHMELTGKEVAYGLLGQVTGTVKELVLKDAYIGGKATSAIGTVAGDLLGGATISDITCENAEIDVEADYVGGIVGKNSGTAKNTVKDSEFAGSISGTSAVGGIVGQAIKNSKIDIVNCENKAAVSATGANVGGICGYALEGATVSLEMCNNSGDVKAGANYAGGMLGYANKKSVITIEDCWNSGTIGGNERVGGLLGYLAEGGTVDIAHCLNSGTIKSNTTHYAAGMVGLAQNGSVTISDSLNVGSIKPGQSIGYSGAIVGGITGTQAAPVTATFNNVYYMSSSSSKGANVVASAAAYVAVKGTGVFDATEVELKGEEALRYTTLDFKEYWTIVENSTPALRAFTAGTIVGQVSKIDISWYDESETELTIYDEADLWGVVLLSETHDFAGQTIKLGANIDVTEGYRWQSIGKHIANDAGDMIGETFAGTFDGNGYTITGLYANTVGNVVAIGPFGEVSGTVQNLKLADYHITDLIVVNTTDIADNSIDSKEELWAFALLTQYEDFAGKTITLGANITLNDVTSADWYKADGIRNWQPIGKYTDEKGFVIGKAFAGTFNGNGKVITGLYANAEECAALFGPFGEATGNIQNLQLANCYIGEEVVVDTTWYGEATYVVDSQADLWGLSLLSRYDDFAGKTIQLGADITLDSNKDWEPIGKYTDETGLVIGKEFTGIFNGNSKKITGLTIELSGKDEAFGLFGQLKGTVQDLKLENVNISGTGKAVGSVAGALMGGAQVNRVSSENAVINVSGVYTGGLVGQNAGTTKNIVQNSYFQGSVNQSGGSGLTGVAGIVGYANTNSVLDALQCKVEGTVTGAALNTRAVSGIIGLGDKGSNLTITGCINGASLSGGYYTGGICGLANQNTIAITDSINAGEITGDATHKGSVVGRFNGATCKPTLSNVYYLKVEGLEAYKNNGATITGTAIPLETIKGDLGWYDVTAIEQTTAPKVTYTIDSAEDLWGFALVSRINDFAGKTIKLGEDISLNNTTGANWYSTATSWAPIGQYCNGSLTIGKVFAGTYDGQNKTITGLYINMASTTEQLKQYGLFGSTSGTITNLMLDTSAIVNNGHSNSQKVGTVVGAMTGGKLENVQSTNATINTVAHHLGGLVGYYKATTEGILNHCLFEGSITVNGSNMQNTGGLIGFVDNANMQIHNSLNMGTVTSTSGKKIGGLCGYLSTGTLKITDCVNAQIVSSSTENNATVVGAVAGTSSKKGTVIFDDVYYLVNGTQKAYNNANAYYIITNSDKCNPKTEAELKSLGENDLNSDHWIFEQGQLPALKPILVTQ